MIAHRDPNTIVCFNLVVRIYKREPIVLNELPVCASWKHSAGDLRSAEGAAVNGNGAAYPEARRGHFDWRSDVNAEVQV